MLSCIFGRKKITYNLRDEELFVTWKRIKCTAGRGNNIKKAEPEMCTKLGHFRCYPLHLYNL